MPLLTKECTQRMSLARFVQSLYGGGGRELEREISRINSIPTPYALPPGSLLLVPDPAAVRL